MSHLKKPEPFLLHPFGVQQVACLQENHTLFTRYRDVHEFSLFTHVQQVVLASHRFPGLLSHFSDRKSILAA